MIKKRSLLEYNQNKVLNNKNSHLTIIIYCRDCLINLMLKLLLILTLTRVLPITITRYYPLIHKKRSGH